MPIIEVNHLTKEYQLGHLASLKQTALNTLKRLSFQQVQERERFLALDDVNFHIEEGEVVGIIGHNGAGKSTLLKHLANISKPTKGQVIVRGSVAPLIEVGAGVHPELTGRENIFLNGAILGIPKEVIRQKLDEIIEFSELEQFIDTPVKRYSSGMQVKLGFSIATSMQFDILIIDEVLAVGDLAFQRKCLDRMEQFIKNEGKTVLIVGHNIRQLERICTRTILLKSGRIVLDGEPGVVSKSFFEESIKQAQFESQRSAKYFGSKNTNFDVKKVEVNPDYDNENNTIKIFSDVTFRIIIYSSQKIDNVEINIGLHNPEMVFVTKASSLMQSQNVSLKVGDNVIEVTFPKLPLCPGPYGLGIGIYDWARHPLFGGTNFVNISVVAEIDDLIKLPISTLTYLPSIWNFKTK